MGRYDHCLTNSIWQRTSIEITDTQVANNLKNIAIFYHFDGCDEWKVLYEQQFPILVAFREGDGNDGPLHIAVLNRKPFQAPVKYIKTAKPEDPKKLFRFACKKNSWCVDISLLQVKESNNNYTTYTNNPNTESHNIITPITKLIVPVTINDNPNFYDCYEFIKYNKQDMENSRSENINSLNYKLKHDVINKLLRE
jgi:hypothetical protein